MVNENNKLIIIVGIPDDGLERIKQYDPAVIEIEKLPDDVRDIPIASVIITAFSKVDIDFLDRQPRPTHSEVITHFCRGFTIREGDVKVDKYEERTSGHGE